MRLARAPRLLILLSGRPIDRRPPLVTGMDRFTLSFFALAFSVLAASASSHDKLSALFEQEWQYRLHEYPELATLTGDKRFNDRLTDYSASAYQQRAEHDRAALAAFRKISPVGLTSDDKINLALMQRELKLSVDTARFRQWEMPVSQ